MSIDNEDVCYNPIIVHTCPRYFNALVKVKHAGITCHDQMMLFLEYWEIQTFFW